VLPETKTNEQANHPIYLIIFNIHQLGAMGAIAAFSTINVVLRDGHSTLGPPARWSWQQIFFETPQ